MGSIFTLDSATLDALEKVARASGKSPSSLARKALRNFLENYWDMLEVKCRECSGEKPVLWARVKQESWLTQSHRRTRHDIPYPEGASPCKLP